MSSEKDNIWSQIKCHISFILSLNLIYHYALIKITNGCVNNQQNSSKTKIGEHILCGYSMLTIWGFDHIEDKHT